MHFRVLVASGVRSPLRILAGSLNIAVFRRSTKPMYKAIKRPSTIPDYEHEETEDVALLWHRRPIYRSKPSGRQLEQAAACDEQLSREPLPSNNKEKSDVSHPILLVSKMAHEFVVAFSKELLRYPDYERTGRTPNKYSPVGAASQGETYFSSSCITQFYPCRPLWSAPIPAGLV